MGQGHIETGMKMESSMEIIIIMQSLKDLGYTASEKKLTLKLLSVNNHQTIAGALQKTALSQKKLRKIRPY